MSLHSCSQRIPNEFLDVWVPAKFVSIIRNLFRIYFDKLRSLFLSLLESVAEIMKEAMIGLMLCSIVFNQSYLKFVSLFFCLKIRLLHLCWVEQRKLNFRMNLIKLYRLRLLSTGEKFCDFYLITIHRRFMFSQMLMPNHNDWEPKMMIGVQRLKPPLRM